MGGEEYMAQADKKLKSFGWFSGDQKFEDAAELYTKAANQFKNNKQCECLYYLPFWLRLMFM